MDEKKETEVKRIVIELPEDDYRTLKFIKNLVGLEWKDMLIHSAMQIVEDLGGEEKFMKYAKTILSAAKKLAEKE